MKLKRQIILALVSIILTGFLFVYEYKYDNGPGSDPIDVILIVGSIYSLIFYGLLNMLLLVGKVLFTKPQGA